MTETPVLLTELRRVGDALGHALQHGSDDLVTSIARTARTVFGAAACSVALLSDDGTELVFTTASGGSDEISGMRMPAGQGIAGWVATTGQPLAVSNLAEDPRFAANIADRMGYQPTEILACPVATEDRLIGVMEILDRDSGRAGAHADLELLSMFARQAALAIDASVRSLRIGAVLLRAAAGAVDGDLAAALAAAAANSPSDDGLLNAAVAFAELARAGPDEQLLAAQVLRDVGDFVMRTRGWA
jgi:GAF domain-containing protein